MNVAEILVGVAAALYYVCRSRRRGKCVCALVKLRLRGYRTPLPSVQLANVRSLANEIDKLLLLFIPKDQDFADPPFCASLKPQ